jgi:hypothetical protein
MSEHVPVEVWDLATGEPIAPNPLEEMANVVASGGNLTGHPVLARILLLNTPPLLVNAQFDVMSTVIIPGDTTIMGVEFYVNDIFISCDTTQHSIQAGDTFSITPRLTLT